MSFLCKSGKTITTPEAVRVLQQLYEMNCKEKTKVAAKANAGEVQEEQKKSTQKAATKASKKKQDEFEGRTRDEENEAELLQLKQRLEAIITKYECLVAQIVVKPLTESNEPYRSGVEFTSPNVLLVIVDAIIQNSGFPRSCLSSRDSKL